MRTRWAIETTWLCKMPELMICSHDMTYDVLTGKPGVHVQVESVRASSAVGLQGDTGSYILHLKLPVSAAPMLDALHSAPAAVHAHQTPIIKIWELPMLPSLTTDMP